MPKHNFIKNFFQGLIYTAFICSDMTFCPNIRRNFIYCIAMMFILMKECPSRLFIIICRRHSMFWKHIFNIQIIIKTIQSKESPETTAVEEGMKCIPSRSVSLTVSNLKALSQRIQSNILKIRYAQDLYNDQCFIC